MRPCTTADTSRQKEDGRVYRGPWCRQERFVAMGSVSCTSAFPDVAALVPRAMAKPIPNPTNKATMPATIGTHSGMDEEAAGAAGAVLATTGAPTVKVNAP